VAARIPPLGAPEAARGSWRRISVCREARIWRTWDEGRTYPAAVEYVNKLDQSH
jgi:hypothetical protein